MPTRPITIAVDAMGGDRGPGEVVNGVVQAALGRNGAVEFVLVGDQVLTGW